MQNRPIVFKSSPIRIFPFGPYLLWFPRSSRRSPKVGLFEPAFGYTPPRRGRKRVGANCGLETVNRLLSSGGGRVSSADCREYRAKTPSARSRRRRCPSEL